MQSVFLRGQQCSAGRLKGHRVEGVDGVDGVQGECGCVGAYFKMSGLTPH